MKVKDFIPASKPRNPVVRQQQTSGAGAHRDKKKEQKQGYEKHKGKDVSESEKKKGVDGKACWKGYRYAGKEKKADGSYKDKCVKIESTITDETFKLKLEAALEERGLRMPEARKNHGYDDAGFSLAPGHDEGEPVYNPRYDRTGQYDRKSKYSQDYDYNTGKPLGSEPKKKGYVFYNVADPQTAQKLGLKQTKSGKWYLDADDTWMQQTADKVFGKGRYWEPK